jgi:hypothetical protein
MTCEAVGKLIPLYWYGELTPDMEEQMEDHLHVCLECTQELERQRSLVAALDRRQVDVNPAFLTDCRRDLLASLRGDEAQARKKAGVRWRLLMEPPAEFFRWLSRYRQPIGAMALLAIGFMAARFVPTPSSPPTFSPISSDQVFASVRSVQPDLNGRVQIAFDETHRRVVTGRMDDQNIRRLLLAGARDDYNTAVRVESVGLLKADSGSGEIREALLNAVAHDPNPGVRLKALEGLKPLAGDQQVRKTLAQVLQADDNPALRMQVIDLLVDRRDDSMVGVLQNVVQTDNNNYVRLKCEKALKEMNASVGTF